MTTSVFRKLTAAAVSAAVLFSSAVSAGAANWGQTGATGENGKTAEIISANSSSVTFTSAQPDVNASVWLDWGQICAPEEDPGNIAKATWDVTYTGLDKYAGKEPIWFVAGGSGSSDTKGNWIDSKHYERLADNVKSWDEKDKLEENGGKPEWSSSVTVSDSITFAEGSKPQWSLLISDWTHVGDDILDLSANGITITVSNMKIYDRSGKEIRQGVWSSLKAYSWTDIVKNKSDLSKVFSIEYKVTYSGLTSLNGTNQSFIKGVVFLETSAGFRASPGYQIKSDGQKDGKYIWTTDTVQAKEKITLGNSYPKDDIIFADTSYGSDKPEIADIFAGKITITISDLKLYDKTGKEIATKPGLDIAKPLTVEEKPAASSKPVVTAAAKKTKVTLTWGAVENATKYRIYKLENGKLTKLANTKKTGYTVKNLTSGTEYTFVVRAYVNGKWTKVAKSDYVTVKTK